MNASNVLESFRAKLRDVDRIQKQELSAGLSASSLVSERCHLIDAIIVEIWRDFELDVSVDGTTPPVLAAVGGYGRGELHPHSDIDLLILLPDDAGGSFNQPIERFIMFMWDIGLEVGHSVRTVNECVELSAQDITIATNLMEARLLFGDESMFNRMQNLTGVEHIWSSHDFFRAKLDEQINRHHRYGDTAYNLEPNIKESPGGLRDLQIIGWVAKRHYNVSTLQDLVSKGFLSQSEHDDLANNQDFLWKIRFALHYLAGRREDRLLFEYQPSLAAQFGYSDNDRQLAVEQFMKRYYRTIRQLSRLNEMLLQLFQEEILYVEEPSTPHAINNRFQSRKGFIEVANDQVFSRYPFALLEIFLLLQTDTTLKGVRAGTIRLIRSHVPLIDARFRDDLRCKSLFMEIIKQPHGITHELRRMNDYGVLGAYLPVFGAVIGQMQFDLFHVYTVDEHTLFVVRNLRRFTVPEFRDELPHCSELVAQVPKPEVLYLAGLFHDIAKGRGGDHSELGANDAAVFCRNHGMSDYDASIVAWLVRNHLVMSRVSQREDIENPEVISEFSTLVGDKAHLDYLYLLTVADMRGTSPTVWNSWKGALLRELYDGTLRWLRRETNVRNHANQIDTTRKEARRRLHEAGIDDGTIDGIWERLGDDYFSRYSAEDIQWHTRSIISNPGTLPLILLQASSRHGCTDLFVHTHANDTLFATVTSVLDQLGLNITDARIIASRDGYTLDTYIVLEEDGSPVTDAVRISEITKALHRQILNQTPSVVTRRMSRRHAHFKIDTRILFDTDEHNNWTVMNITTHDRPGLLANVGRALQENRVRLHNARIATFGERAEDLFFVTDENDMPLDSTTQGKLAQDVKRRLAEM
jgi:[protein-PII] uridylyltransferase